MVNRREIITGATIAAVLVASPAAACKAPASKDRNGYTKAIDRMLAAWWARDFDRFLEAFRHPNREEPLPDRTLFDAHYVDHSVRFRAGLLFNGASAIVQVITPQQPNFEQGICGGYAKSDLFLVKFYPGVREPAVAESVQFLDMDLLAHAEWKQLPGASKVKIEPYWRLEVEPESK
jgi:hypothetical protein